MLLFSHKKKTRNLMAPRSRQKIASGGINADVTIISKTWPGACDVCLSRCTQKRPVSTIHINNATRVMKRGPGREWERELVSKPVRNADNATIMP